MKLASKLLRAPQLGPEDDRPVLEELHPDSPNLLIVFNSMQRQPHSGISQYELQKASRTLPVSRLYLKDPYQLWYQRGLPGLAANVQELVEYLKARLLAIQPERLVITGNSMGGFAALLFGCLLGADSVHAFSPKTFINPFARLLIWDYWFWREQIRLVLEAPGSRQTWDVRPWLRRNTTSTRYTIYYSPSHRLDNIHARRMRGMPGVILESFPEGGHALIRTLHGRGELLPILAGAFQLEPERWLQAGHLQTMAEPVQSRAATE